MGVYFVIIKGYGYVIPKKLLTQKERDQIMSLEGMDGVDLRLTEQGCYKESIDTMSFISLKTTSKILANRKVSLGTDLGVGFNCDDFAVTCYSSEESDDDNYFKNRQLFLSEHSKKLDEELKKHVPELYYRIKKEYNNRYENWIFGLLE